MCACLGDSAGDFHLKREFSQKGWDGWAAREKSSRGMKCALVPACCCSSRHLDAKSNLPISVTPPTARRWLRLPEPILFMSPGRSSMYLLVIFFLFFLLRGWLNMLFRGELSWEKLKGCEAIRPELLQCGAFNEIKTNGVSMKDVPLLYFASENCWLWLTGVQLQMVSLYGPMQTMSKDQYATQTLLRQNWKSNKKSVFNARCDQYSDLVNRVSPWWNRISAVTKTVCPHVWLLNTLSKVVHTCAHTCEMHRKKVSKDAVHCVKNNVWVIHTVDQMCVWCRHFWGKCR